MRLDITRFSFSWAGITTRFALRPMVLALGLGLGTSLAQAGDAVDTRVTFTIADNDLSRGPQSTGSTGNSNLGSPSIPNSVPQASNRLFFDDYDRRDKGFENLSHLVLYANEPGFFEGLTTEAAMVLRAQTAWDGSVSLRDDGSYLKLTKKLSDDSRLELTAFPISADRFRLGYSYDITWGGSSIFPGVKAAPGLRLDWRSKSFYAYGGFKTGLGRIKQDDATIETDTVGGFLGGFGVNILDELQLEAGGGFFYRGRLDRPDLIIADAGSERLDVPAHQGYGGSVKLNYAVGMPVGESIDIRLYKNDPLKPQNFFKPEKYDGGFAIMGQLEASVLGQTLQDPDQASTTLNQWAIAGDAIVRMKVGHTRVHILAVYRTLAFILYNVPSLTPFVGFPDGVDAKPEIFGSIAVDHHIPGWHLTPGFTVGLQRPAYVRATPPSSSNYTGDLQTIIIKDQYSRIAMDADDDVALVMAAKGVFRWDLSTAMAVLGELQYSYDPNLRVLSQDDRGVTYFAKTDPNIIGFNLMLQARF